MKMDIGMWKIDSNIMIGLNQNGYGCVCSVPVWIEEQVATDWLAIPIITYVNLPSGFFFFKYIENVINVIYLY